MPAINPDTSQLHHLPPCVLNRVVGFLPLSAYASLALTSRRMLQSFGPVFRLVNRDRAERVRLLDLLERDLDDIIKCTACNKLHPALKTIIPPASSLARYYKCTGPPPGDCTIPTRITPEIVASILKLSARGKSYHHLVKHINTSRTYVREDEVLIQISHVARVCAGNVIVRTQQVWSTVHLDMDAIEELSEDPSDMLSYVYNLKPRGLESICLHHNWGKHCHALCDHHEQPSHSSSGYSYAHATGNGNGNGNGYRNASGSGSGSSGGSGGGNGSSSRNGDRNGNSNGNGNGNGNGDGDGSGNSNSNGTRLSRQTQYSLCPPFSKIATRNFGRLTALTKTQGCLRCHTDFQIEVTRIPPPFGAGLILTTWKNLGRGSGDAHDPWASHDVLIATPPRDPAEVGNIRKMFDAGGVPRARSGITRHNTKQIQILADELRRREGADVAITAVPDDNTGLFSNFVPLDVNWFPAGEHWVV